MSKYIERRRPSLEKTNKKFLSKFPKESLTLIKSLYLSNTFYFILSYDLEERKKHLFTTAPIVMSVIEFLRFKEETASNDKEKKYYKKLIGINDNEYYKAKAYAESCIAEIFLNFIVNTNYLNIEKYNFTKLTYEECNECMKAYMKNRVDCSNVIMYAVGDLIKFLNEDFYKNIIGKKFDGHIPTIVIGFIRDCYKYTCCFSPSPSFKEKVILDE